MEGLVEKVKDHRVKSLGASLTLHKWSENQEVRCQKEGGIWWTFDFVSDLGNTKQNHTIDGGSILMLKNCL